MGVGADISGELSDQEWLDRLRRESEESGYFSDLGARHAAYFAERSHDVLFVAFETLFSIRSTSENGKPVAFEVAEPRDWSHLTLLATAMDWYRAPEIYAYFDGLVDHGFFEEFDTVVFYGAGLCAYAAAAYSVVAPGAQVILVAPQATLARPETEWDARFPNARRLDFRSRYGYAPDMIEAADAALLLFDPDESEDAMHASLFDAPNILHHRYRRGRSGNIDADLRALGLIGALAEAAVEERLAEPAIVARIMQARKRHMPYLRALLARVLAEDRPALTARLCRAVLKEVPNDRFRHHLILAERRLRGETDDESEDEDTLS